MKLGARSTLTSLLAIATLAIAQLLPSVAAAQTAGTSAPPQTQPAYPPPPRGYYGYPPPQGYPQQPPQVYQRPARRPKGLLIAGPIVLGASYAFTALLGLTMQSTDTTSDGAYCVNCQTVGTRLMIPLLGPWLAMPEADGSDGKMLTAMLGLAQATGLVMTIVGISRYAASAPDRTTAASRGGLQFALVPSKGGGLGVLGGSF
jgi:hypothetical protein